ncbi:hypothetical protein QFZ60_001550 [Arthrobacter sp. B2I5]|nr:hypothetical protein [Arthrobacter sp. B2I5]
MSNDFQRGAVFGCILTLIGVLLAVIVWSRMP